MNDAADERRAVMILLSVVFLMIAGFGLVIPLLPFFARAFGAPPWQITLLFSAFSIGQFLGEPFWGRLSDRIGRKPVLVLTIAAVALSYAALAFAPNIGVALAIRLVTGFFAGNMSTLQGAMADITPPEKRASRMGFMGAAFSTGFTAGPAIGGLLAQPSRGLLGFQLPLLAAAAFAAASTIAVVAFVREGQPQVAPGRAHRSRMEGLKAAAGDAVIARILAIGFIVVVGFAGIEATYGLWAQARFSWGPKEVGLAFTFIGVLGAVCQGYLSGRLVRTFGEATTVIGGLVFMGLGLVTQGLAPVWPMAMLGFALVCVGQSICWPNLATLISQAAPPERQGEMLGLNMGAMALARIIGPVFAGWLFSSIAPGAPFVSAALVILPGLWFAAQVKTRVQIIA